MNNEKLKMNFIINNDDYLKQNPMTSLDNINTKDLFTLFPVNNSINYDLDLSWNQLIFIPLRLNFYNEVLLQENILWDVMFDEIKEIKEFCANWLIEKFFILEGLFNTDAELFDSRNNQNKIDRANEAINNKEIVLLKPIKEIKFLRTKSIETIEGKIFI